MLIWQPQFYLSHPIEILKIWHGGMSFHGGLAGVIVAGWLFCRKRHIQLATVADAIAVPAIFALAIGRIANFINGELWGRVTDVSWCVQFPDVDGCRHPSQLYAAGKRFLVFGWLLWLHVTQKWKPGFIFWNFVLFEGIGRIIVDFFREDVLYYGLSKGQWMSLLMAAIAGWVLIRLHRNDIMRLLGRK
jgi:phosphatidylglycerol:prolipoprotein diacylglycerol transferase